MIITHTLIEADKACHVFISGTHYNRCKRLHPIISLASQLIYFKFFLKEENLELSTNLVKELKEIKQSKIDSSKNILADVDIFSYHRSSLNVSKSILREPA